MSLDEGRLFWRDLERVKRIEVTKKGWGGKEVATRWFFKGLLSFEMCLKRNLFLPAI